MKKLSHFLQIIFLNKNSSKTTKTTINSLMSINTLITRRINKIQTVPFSVNVSHFLQNAENGTLYFLNLHKFALCYYQNTFNFKY
jgi:hypothetical protein